MKVDVVYLCHGREEFTRASLPTLIANTDWSLVDNFIVYNDSAPDHMETTRYLLNEVLGPEKCDLTLRQTNLHGPVGVMNHFLNRCPAEAFVKIDNDIVVPPGWLEKMLAVMEVSPECSLLGMQPDMGGREPDGWDGTYSALPCTHIGGVGLMRVQAFRNRPSPVADGRFGFTEWQHEHNPGACWISPDIRMFALDQLPLPPWDDYTAEYVREGLNRQWPKYTSIMDWYWDWWLT